MLGPGAPFHQNPCCCCCVVVVVVAVVVVVVVVVVVPPCCCTLALLAPLAANPIFGTQRSFSKKHRVLPKINSCGPTMKNIAYYLKSGSAART